MSKIRLSKSKRLIITAFMQQRVLPSEKLEAAYQKAISEFEKDRKVVMKFIKLALEKRFPKKDLEVLERHGLARKISSVRFQTLPTGRIVQFTIGSDDGTFYGPKSVDQFSMDWPVIDLTEAGEKAYDRMKSSDDTVSLRRHEMEAELTSRRAPYRALIAGCTYFEDIAEVWPEVEEIREKVGPGSSLMLLSDEVKEAVRQDVRRRKAFKQVKSNA